METGKHSKSEFPKATVKHLPAENYGRSTADPVSVTVTLSLHRTSGGQRALKEEGGHPAFHLGTEREVGSLMGMGRSQEGLLSRD